MKICRFLAFAVAVAGTLVGRTAEDPAAIAPVGELPEVHHYVYLSELPDPAELTKDAAANGLTVVRVDKTADRVVISYRYPDAHVGTVGYALLSAVRNSDRISSARMEVTKRTTVVTPQPEIVYVERPYRSRVIYRDPFDDFWAPLTLGVGIGWIGSHHGHGWHHGRHHHYRGWSGHGHRRHR